MEARTFLLWFKLDKALLKDNIEEILSRLRELPGLFSPGQWRTALQQRLEDDSYIYVTVNTDGSHVTMRLFISGFLTFDLQCQAATSTTHSNPPQLMMMIRDRLDQIKTYLGKLCIFAKCLDCPIFRSYSPLCPYMVAGDERLLQRDFTELVYEKDSDWQNIKIYKSKQCGNVLYLDDDVMLGESDIEYTENILGLGRNDYTDKTVLILGGGDGGILHELVTRTKPAFVTMVEIDEEVIKACRTHMRSICGSEMDKYDGRYYKIVIGDCVKYLNDAANSNRTFDYIVNDQTELTVERVKYGFKYDHATTCATLDLSLKVLAPRGKYLTAEMACAGIVKHLEGVGWQSSMTTKYIPSFQEEYCFLEAWRADESP